jgi:DNA-binding MarR family transcriptional regulator
MQNAPKAAGLRKNQTMVELLEAVERGGELSQRSLAAELDIALGLVNTYLKRCVKKGLVKVGTAPARRYVYYLTPHGFAEKSRLTVEYMSASFSLVRRAKSDLFVLIQDAKCCGFSRIVLAGASDLAETAVICALDLGVAITAVVDANSKFSRFVGLPLVKSFEDVVTSFDAVLVTDAANTRETIIAATTCYGAERVLVPAFLEPPPAESPEARNDIGKRARAGHRERLRNI